MQRAALARGACSRSRETPRRDDASRRPGWRCERSWGRPLPEGRRWADVPHSAPPARRLGHERQRPLDGLGRRRRALDAFHLPTRLEDHDRTAQGAREPISASVPQRPPTAMTASPDATTARLRPCPIPVTTTWSIHSFARARVSSGEDPDRRASGGLGPARCRGHHLAEAAADDRAAALGEQPPDLRAPSCSTPLPMTATGARAGSYEARRITACGAEPSLAPRVLRAARRRVSVSSEPVAERGSWGNARRRWRIRGRLGGEALGKRGRRSSTPRTSSSSRLCSPRRRRTPEPPPRRDPDPADAPAGGPAARRAASPGPGAAARAGRHGRGNRLDRLRRPRDRRRPAGQHASDSRPRRARARPATWRTRSSSATTCCGASRRRRRPRPSRTAGESPRCSCSSAPKAWASRRWRSWPTWSATRSATTRRLPRAAALDPCRRRAEDPPGDPDLPR